MTIQIFFDQGKATVKGCSDDVAKHVAPLVEDLGMPYEADTKSKHISSHDYNTCWEIHKTKRPIKANFILSFLVTCSNPRVSHLNEGEMVKIFQEYRDMDLGKSDHSVLSRNLFASFVDYLTC